MAEIKAEQVKALRDRTGIGMMECKEALQEAGGDMEKAIEILRKKGHARAQDKAERKAADGAVGAYVHATNRIGVLIEVNCETDFVARNEEFKELVKNLAMQVAASNPQYISPEDVPSEIIEREKEIIRAQIQDAKKPPQIIEKIIEGKLQKFYEEVCLLDQPYIRDDKIKVRDLVNIYISKFGENIKVRRFVRFEIGKY